MAFLFGDSSPFPLDFNFLATLEKFMTAATKIVMLEAESQKHATDARKHADARVVAVEAVKAIHERLVRALGDALDHEPRDPEETIDFEEAHPAAVEYAKSVKTLAGDLMEAQYAAQKRANESEAQALKGHHERRTKAIRAELDTFFRTADLAMTPTQFRLSAQDTRSDVHAVVGIGGGMVLGFELDAAPGWQHPRRVSELAPGLTLTIGVKKSFFKGVVSAEPMPIDDFYIGRVDLHPNAMLLALRRKPDQKDSLFFKARRSERGLSGDFEWPDDPNAKAVSNVLDPDDLAKLDTLWRALHVSFEELLAHKTSLELVELDDEDVFKTQRELALVARLVATFAPIVAEITRKSPNAGELSLKLEDKSGRREEIYLKRDVLTKNLEPLPANGRAVFAPLGLDTWVPAMSVRPPPVR